MLELLRKNQSARIILEIIAGLLIYFALVSLLVYFEKDSAQSAIKDYSNAIWYSLVTLTTVGYGDLFPATIYGRAVGYIFLLLSLGIYGLLIGQITNLMATIKENKKLGFNGTSFEGHAVIIGWNDFGRMVMDQLVGVGKQIAIITNNKADIDLIREQYEQKSIFILYADFHSYESLKKANVEMSSIVFINLSNDTEKLVYILNMKKYFPHLEYVVTLDNGDLKNTFHSAGVSNTISKHEISSKLLASYMFEPDVASYFESITSFAQNDDDYDIKQFLVAPSNPYVGRAYHEVFFELKQQHNCILIGITQQSESGEKQLFKNPQENLTIGAGDYLLMIINGKAFKEIRKIFGVDEGYVRDINPS